MYKHLNKEQRYYIEVKKSNNTSIKKISKAIKVHRSTVHRELKRNMVKNNNYHYMAAQGKSEIRRLQAKQNNRFIKFKGKVLEFIIAELKIHTSPEAISGRLLLRFKTKISHTTIYRYIAEDKINGGKLFKYLPHRGKKYKKSSTNGSKIPNRVDIMHRPKIVNKKVRIGDNEADTIVGKKNGSKECLFTMVDRVTKYTHIRKVKDRTAQSIQYAIESIYINTTIPFLTITPDNGSEFYNHESIAENIGCKFYFARPYKSYDRGLNEHTNGLIRRFLPKKTDFATVSDDRIAEIEYILNNRPRKSLGFLTPNEVMNKYLKRKARHKIKCVALQT